MTTEYLFAEQATIHDVVRHAYGYSPPLTDRLAGRSKEGIEALVQKLLRVLRDR